MNNLTEKMIMDRLIQQALEEDIGNEDVTTNAVMPEYKKGMVKLIAKQDGGAYSVRVNGSYLELYCPYGRSEAMESWLAKSSYQPMLVVLEGRKPLLEGAGL